MLALIILSSATITVQSLSGHESQSVEPFSFTEADGNTAPGNLVQTKDGLIHFVWNECTGEDQCSNPTPDGRFILRHRSLEPESGTWSDITTIREEDHNLIGSRLYAHENTLHLTWLQGWAPDSNDPVHLWHCTLDSSFSCLDAERISPGIGQALYQAGAIGPEGNLRVVWQEENTEPTTSRLLYREMGETGWGPLVEFPTEARWQRNAAVAVDSEGMAHVTWTDKPSDTPLQETDERILHATVAAGASVPSSPSQISDGPLYKHKSSLVTQGDVVHAVYSNMTDVYHRIFHPDQGWGPPVNITRDMWSGGGMDPMVALAPDGTLVAAWVNITRNGLMMWAAQYVDNMWQRPYLVGGPPYTFHFTSFLVHGTGTLHFAWVGTHPEIKENQMYHLTVPLQREDRRPPEVVRTVPRPDGWTNGIQFQLEADLLLDAPLDRSKTILRLNGETLEFQTSGTKMTATVDILPEGQHEVDLYVRDTAGGETEHTWSFRVDQTAPGFTITASDASGATNVSGWRSQPVTIKGDVDDKGGAPARIQWGAEGFIPWTDLEPVGLTLPEGFLYELSFRVVDKAGNTAGPVHLDIGWDATPPNVSVDPPARWWRSQTLPITFQKMAEPEVPDSGSPEWVRFTLSATDERPENKTVTVSVSDGKAAFAGVSEGEYELHTYIFDEAGNVQEPDLGPWQVGIDTTLPRVVFESTENGGLSIHAFDDISGLNRVALQSGDGEVLREWRFEGEHEAQLEVSALDVEQIASIWVDDLAGNAVLGRPSPTDWSVEDVTPPLIDPEDVPRLDETEKSGGSESVTVPAPPILLVLIVFLVVIRARCRKRNIVRLLVQPQPSRMR